MVLVRTGSGTKVGEVQQPTVKYREINNPGGTSIPYSFQNLGKSSANGSAIRGMWYAGRKSQARVVDGQHTTSFSTWM